MMPGYDVNFLDGYPIPLPTFSTELDLEILRNQGDLRDDMIADYIHYSVVMNQHENKRSLVFSALNINQNHARSTDRTNRWKIDRRIGSENQLNNDYYHDNPWDRGHMAMRNNTSHGATLQEAQRASDETFYFSNCCLQHKNLNQDEWLSLEEWVGKLELDADGRITVFSGPFYGRHDRTIRPSGRTTALIPAGFWKLIAFKNKTEGNLEVRAFVMHQDEETLFDRRGRRRYTNQSYQVTTTEIEILTGLQFIDILYEANPLYFSEPDESTRTDTNVGDTPEANEVSGSGDIVNQGQTRQTVKDDIVDVFISMAMVNPEGRDEAKEWIALLNMGSETVDLTGWTLTDNSQKTIKLDQTRLADGSTLKPGESRVIRQLGEIKLSNKKDLIILKDRDGARVDRVDYLPHMVKPGKPVLFLTPRDTLN
ncbi:DNA/RNA non-specific endonuclease [Acanthopleuribacter pedis]|uniref:DNA/RNA non-specific endonuclease n=1 Tax=Acanthopleuribacter pedis TaxID=442870 RepID=A0A8J7Q8X7_9BACT|nr:DNA/RNA non-specific endonuclease [Acanthopleuribacter pedis]MBO1319902.1 DNA/RNA non-specific endonuclease [Acanthopleuribacter pedis]